MKVEKATQAQLQYIEVIENALAPFGVRFTGTTKKEAQEFLMTYVPYYRDMERIDRGYPPYWTALANQPSHFKVIPEILEYINWEWSNMADLNQIYHEEYGDFYFI